jgi:RNA ligase
MDGSLGIAYRSSRGWEISTRGSFESEQAAVATSLLNGKYADSMAKMNPNWTYLFEIIYPENRIVVDYGKEEKLVLLGVIMTTTDHEIPLLPLFADLGFPLPRVFEAQDLESLPRDTQNFEGYVVRFENGLRVKVKLDDYVRLHKLMTGITPNRIWEMLASGQDVEAMVKELPDEMYEEVMCVVEELRNEHVAYVDIHIMVLAQLEVENLSRKEQAAKIIQQCKDGLDVAGLKFPLNSAIMFMILDQQVEWAKQKAWNLVKPKDGNKLICKADLAG